MKKKNKQAEKELEDKCCMYARELGIIAIKLEDNSHKGIPDRLFFHNGKGLFVEFKSPTGKGRLSPEQKFWIEILGESAAVVDDFYDFTVLLNNHFLIRVK